jgi:Translation elongation factors (GTPases)
MLCGSSFKNKGVQTWLDYVCAYLRYLRWIQRMWYGTNPETCAKEDRKPKRGLGDFCFGVQDCSRPECKPSDYTSV